MTTCSLRTRSQVAFFLLLWLSPGAVTAAAPAPSAATGQLPAAPELADLIPRATALAARRASLERTIAADADLSRLEQQLREIGARTDDRARELSTLKASADQPVNRLPHLRTAIESIGDTLTEVGAAVTARVRTLGNLRTDWLAARARWHAWQATLRSDDSLAEITATLSRAQGDIDTALDLLRERLEPLLGLQQRIGALQTRITLLGAEIEGVLASSRGLEDISPGILSTPYASHLVTALETLARPGSVQIAWPAESFFAREGWVLWLQGVLSLALALVLYRHRRRLAQVEHWRFISARPIAGGVLVGVLCVIPLYERLPDLARLVLSAVVGVAFVRLLEGMVTAGWRRAFLYGVLALSVATNLCYVLDLPRALFRLYILAVAAVSLVCCLRWAAVSRRLRETLVYAWVLWVAAILFAVVLFAELRGDAKLAEFLFVSSLRSLAFVLVFGLLRHLVQGGLEWAVLAAARRGVALTGSNVAVLVLTLLLDVLIGVVVLSGLLTAWQVYDSPENAIASLLSMHATIASQQITLGYVLLAIGSLVASYFASWALQTLLAVNVLTRRNVDVGVRISVTRLLHYALVSLGFVIALVVLGIDLTKLTLLASALGVGIGFGLQTIVNNFVCGLILLFERPLRVGDTIELEGQWVKITKIGLRSTMVRTFDQADLIVPNTQLITNQVTNWTLTDRHARVTLAVGAAYGSDVTLVMRTLKDCALSHPGVMSNPEPQVLFRSFGDSALHFDLRAWVADVDTRLQVASDLHQEIDRRFRQAGIQIPFPQRDLHVRSLEPATGPRATLEAPRA
jgi:potassium-dependent mechanosensitive channel